MKSFRVKNVNCQNCANTIKEALKDDFGVIEVNVEEKKLTLNISEEKVQEFKDALDGLGFEAVCELDESN